MKKLAGRCECGLALELVAKDQEAHLVCAGLRRCRQCLEVKPLATGFRKHRRLCRACQDAYHLAYIQRRMRDEEEFRERHRAASRLWNKRAYRSNKGGYAERMREKNRRRYQTDPEYAERMRSRQRGRQGRAAA